jgi:hypothetical protein
LIKSNLPENAQALLQSHMDQYPPMIYPGAELDQLGREGWELVTSYAETETVWPTLESGVHPNVRTAKVVMIFKRPIQ